MTYLEKLKRDSRPDVKDTIAAFSSIEHIIENTCPSSWGYEDCVRDNCNPHSYCKECWNREIPNSTSWIRGKDGVVRCGGCGAEATYIKFGKKEYTDYHITPYCPWCGAPMDAGVKDSE